MQIWDILKMKLTSVSIFKKWEGHGYMGNR